MEAVNFKEMQKKTERLFVPVTPFEKEKIRDFCSKNQISISDLVRHALKKVLSEKHVK